MFARNRQLFRSRSFFYGWIIVGIFFMVEMVIYGIRYSFSVFYLSILDEFGWSRAGTVGIFSLNIIIYGLMAPFSGGLADKFGPKKIVPVGTLMITLGMIACSMASEIWHFYILFGVIIAMGTCFAGWSQFAPILADWFVKRRATALGIVTAGFGLCFLLSFFTEFLILNLGWKGAFVILGVLPTLIISPLTVLFVKSKPEELGLLPDGASSSSDPIVKSEMAVIEGECSPTDLTLTEAIKTSRFWMIFLAQFFFWGLGANMILAHQVAFIHDIGYSTVFAASVLGLYGVLYAVGNLFGFISDKLGRETTFTFGSIGMVAAMFLLVTTRDVASPWKIYTYVVLFGFCMGINTPTLNAIPPDLFQGRSFGAINGLLMLGFGLGGALGPWFGGYIFDRIGTYLPAFYVAILAFIVPCIVVWIAAPRKFRPPKRG